MREYNKIIWVFFSTKLPDDVNWPLQRVFKADVLGVSPSSERIEELWVVCVYLQNGWEDGNEKNTNTLGE